MKVRDMFCMVVCGFLCFVKAESPMEFTEMVDAPWLHLAGSQTPIEEMYEIKAGVQDLSIVDISETVPVNCERKGEENEGGGNGRILWGTDVLVSSGSSSVYWISHAHSADMSSKRNYAAVLSHYSGSIYDTVSHYRSDNGLGWTLWAPIYHPYGNEVWQVEVLVGRGANPWIYTFTRSTNAGTPNSGALGLRRMRDDLSEVNWAQIALPGDSIGNFAVDMDEDEVLYIIYERELPSGGTGIYATSSTDQGLTWETPIFVDRGVRRNPDIAIGKDNYLYVAYVVNDSIVRVGRCNNGIYGLWVFQDIETDGDEEYNPIIAASRMQTPPSQTAWVLYRHFHSSSSVYDVHYGYTVDGGVSWIYGVWPPMNYAYGNVRYPRVATSIDYPYDLCAALGTSLGSYDSVVTAWAYASDPTSWHNRQVVNDYDATGSFPNSIDLNYARGGSTVLYRQYGSGNVWFDFWFNVGVNDAIPRDFSNTIISSTNKVRVKFSLPNAGSVDLSLYNISGQRLNSMDMLCNAGWNFVDLDLPSSGVFFLTVGDNTIRIIVAR
ncbi:MAG: hypothetical protein PHQ71_04100 [Candidatus Hydrothermia bacterium]|nr:hypothetical protein [Candidatus Hydrothermia bacterium]